MPKKRIDASIEEREFLEASEAYLEAEDKKTEWGEEAKSLKKDMAAKRTNLLRAREGKAPLDAFNEEASG